MHTWRGALSLLCVHLLLSTVYRLLLLSDPPHRYLGVLKDQEVAHCSK